VYENRVLRRIFEPKRDEVMGGWIKLQYKELHDLYSLPSIIRMMCLKFLSQLISVTPGFPGPILKQT
jgi:hypothetical protein